MRTRCANCNTIFRITPEQLRARNGLVRCGQCQGIFNAFDSLVEEVIATASPTPASHSTAVTPQEQETVAMPELEAAPLDPIDAALAVQESPEESARAARDAGLVAARELSETPGYNRWAASALGADSASDFAAEPRRLLWPFVITAIVLVITLLAQLAYYYRSELVLQLPELRSVFTSLGLDIPLQRQVDLVTIEASDLQADNARGLLVLQATLKNRASYALAWPALELTLTDTNDSVVARRVVNPDEYLPSKIDSRAFAGTTEIGLKLWIESRQPAAGYRLYVFYP